MILELLFNFILTFLELVFGWVSFPDVPASVYSTISYVFDRMRDGIGFLNLIVNMNLVKACLPVILVVENFDKVYSVVMWILKKIPFLGMK